MCVSFSSFLPQRRMKRTASFLPRVQFPSQRRIPLGLTYVSLCVHLRCTNTRTHSGACTCLHLHLHFAVLPVALLTGMQQVAGSLPDQIGDLPPRPPQHFPWKVTPCPLLHLSCPLFLYPSPRLRLSMSLTPRQPTQPRLRNAAGIPAVTSSDNLVNTPAPPSRNTSLRPTIGASSASVTASASTTNDSVQSSYPVPAVYFSNPELSRPGPLAPPPTPTRSPYSSPLSSFRSISQLSLSTKVRADDTTDSQL